MYEIQYRYKDHSLHVRLERDADDFFRAEHEGILPFGKRIWIDFSPFEIMSNLSFEVWVDCGYPAASFFGPKQIPSNDTYMRLSKLIEEYNVDPRNRSVLRMMAALVGD